MRSLPLARVAARAAALVLACSLLLGSPPAAAQDGEEEGYTMNDVGGTLDLPRGWEMQTWADWEFKAKSPDGLLMRLYVTPFQVQPGPDAAQAWAAMYQERLEKEGGAGFTDVQADVGEAALAGDKTVPAVRTSMRFSFEKQRTDGVLYAAALPSKGQVVHIEVITAARNDRKAAAALDTLLAGFEQEKTPEQTVGPRVASEEAGFAFTAPDGWREPLPNELAAVRHITEKVGEKGLDPKTCAVAVRPPATGEPDVIFACELYKHLGPVDEYSFEGVEAEVHELFFGRAETPVEPAEQITTGDRVGFFYKPPVAGHPVRLAISPYDKGLVVMWGMAGQLDEEALDRATRTAAESLEFTHEGGGQPIIALDKRLSYLVKYRPTSPPVIGGALMLLVLVGGVGVVVKKKSGGNRYEDI